MDDGNESQLLGIVAEDAASGGKKNRTAEVGIETANMVQGLVDHFNAGIN